LQVLPAQLPIQAVGLGQPQAVGGVPNLADLLQQIIVQQQAANQVLVQQVQAMNQALEKQTQALEKQTQALEKQTQALEKQVQAANQTSAQQVQALEKQIQAGNQDIARILAPLAALGIFFS